MPSRKWMKKYLLNRPKFKVTEKNNIIVQDVKKPVISSCLWCSGLNTVRNLGLGTSLEGEWGNSDDSKTSRREDLLEWCGGTPPFWGKPELLICVEYLTNPGHILKNWSRKSVMNSSLKQPWRKQGKFGGTFLSNSTLQPVSLSRREKAHETLQNKQLIFFSSST